MATRRAAEQIRFDHGAQYFTARDTSFRRYVNSWIADGIVLPWCGRIVALENGTVTQEKSRIDRFVGVPGMNSICKHLSQDVDIRFSTQVSELRKSDGSWHLTTDEGSDLGKCDVAIVSAPAPQTAKLLHEVPQFASAAESCAMHACWSVMVSLPAALELDFQGAFVHGSALSWISCNSSKPERKASPETWVLHASSEWTADHLEDSPETVQSLLLEEFWRATGISVAKTNHCAAHRWRYALPPEPLAENCLFDPELQVAACGDWCAGPRVEGAFLSGIAAAGRVMGLLKNELATHVVTGKQKMLF